METVYVMQDEAKTREQLVHELAVLRQRTLELEASQTEHTQEKRCEN
jgi:hypothetical protein